MATVMLATRNDDMRGYLAAKLKRSGHAVSRVADYHSALTLLEENAYDVLLTTVEADSSDELDLARAARRIDPDMRVMFITGFSAVALMPPAEEGARGMTLGEPVHLNRLGEELRRLVRAA
ncbi:response regulator [Neomegalonema perideroedes]|uniref:response regulator n=1 Tax=Neomegalonema perideroedes TaxID=217219 RepID=UPI000374CAC7|nr:response regulator [Neomegalonema perideroedes]